MMIWHSSSAPPEWPVPPSPCPDPGCGVLSHPGVHPILWRAGPAENQPFICFFFKPAYFSAGWESWFVLWRDQTSTRPVKVQEKQLEHVAGMCAEEGEGTAPFWWQWAVRLTKLSRQTKPLEKIQLLVWKCLDRYSLFLSRRWIKIYQHKALYTHVTVSTWGVALV